MRRHLDDPQPNPPEGRWQRWLDSHAERFFLYARQLTRSESDAKDVLQDALTEAWSKSGGEIPNRGLVLATIRRRSIDLGRSIDRRSRREHNFAADTSPMFVADYAAGDTGDHLAAAIQQLPDHLREVLILRIVEEQWRDDTVCVSSATPVRIRSTVIRPEYVWVAAKYQ